VRIWQVNIQKTLIAHIPIYQGEVQETGDFMLDGVTFPAAEIKVEFLDPADNLFPTGNMVDELDVPSLGVLDATLINAGIATIFVKAEDIGFQGTELQEAINNDQLALAKFEKVRAVGALKMGLISNLDEASMRQHTPKIVFVSAPKSYQTSSGTRVDAQDIDLTVRAFSMGKLHHAMMGTAAVALASAAAIPGTLVNMVAGGGTRTSIRVGHPSGTLEIGLDVEHVQGHWRVERVCLSRSARIIMDGRVHLPLM